MNDQPSLRRELEDAIAANERARAVAMALDALDRGVTSIDDLYRHLSDILVALGEAWQRGTAEVWQEHLASAAVRTIVESCAMRVEAAAPTDRTATVVLAAPSEEYHDLGLRMLADRLALAGWRVAFLGADVPVREVVAAVDELGADAVALSASTHFHRVSLRRYVDVLTADHPHLRVWVGGPAFAHEHDGWPQDMVLDPLAVPGPDGT